MPRSLAWPLAVETAFQHLEPQSVRAGTSREVAQRKASVLLSAAFTRCIRAGR
jgi:hypothetical protein